MSPMWLSVLVIVMLVQATAGAEEAKPPPLDPKYEGEHVFALASSESDLFATYLPALQDPKNQQLLYLVDAKGANLFYLVRDADRVTIKTRSFNLERLIRNESVQIEVDVWLGSDITESKPIYTAVPVNFVKQLYHRKLEGLEPSGLRQTYDIVELPNRDRILIHKIKHTPSFDHIVLVEEAKNCVTQFFTSSASPKEEELLMKLLFCGSIKPLYFEADAFK
ncbi:hypothetical protein [Alteromonas oceanisediminis]|uniref:hypothetical protein n=1 Tax=Alteromonas oceanisediminis TaxID=2836180 RepID=UPI001BD9445F|nr:hypothetical protein [Alteromonas oceanisediminis]MBT0586908.1 hypothetical protein [Alteromonas oceanisediminis]